MAVKIIVDSTADMTPAVAQRVQVIPLTVHFGEQEFLDRVELSCAKFYEMLVESDSLPTTSQATPFAFTEVFEEAVADGSDVVCITLSEKLSGTYQSAVIAASEFPGKVHVVDSGSVAIGMGILVEYALELLDRNLSAEEIARELMRKREQDTNTKADIHEKDMAYLATCRETGRAAAQFYGWNVISCVRDGQMRSIEDIHEEIYRHVAACLED